MATRRKKASASKTRPRTPGYAFKPGDRVLWTDPADETDPGKTGQLATVTKVNVDEGEGVTDDTIVTIRKDDGGKAEVFPRELVRPEGGEDDVRARIASGYYSVLDWPDLPKEPVDPKKVSPGQPTPDDYRKYADALAAYQAAFAAYGAAWEDAKERQRAKEHEFRSDLLKHLNVPADHPKAGYLLDLAREKCHSGGYGGVLLTAEDLVELLDLDGVRLTAGQVGLLDGMLDELASFFACSGNADRGPDLAAAYGLFLRAYGRGK